MIVILARFVRLFHHMRCLQRNSTIWVDTRVVYVGCECGRVFYMTRNLKDREAMCQAIRIWAGE